MKKMEATDTVDISPCGRPLPDLEVPMINTMVSCLSSEHQKINFLTIQLALAAARLAVDPDDASAKQRAVEVWDEIRRDLWPHLQIEDELVFSWGEARNAIPGSLLDTLKKERDQMHKLVTELFNLSSESEETAQPANQKLSAAKLQTLAQTLDLHVEHYDSEVLPAILRAVFRK
jgi:hemerythrin-like domain-containing protein